MPKGYLKVNVYSDTIANPVKSATVKVLKDNKEITTLITDENGQTPSIELETVDKNYSETNQSQVRPYETYDIEVTALGLTPTRIEGVQIFDNITSIQNVDMTSIDENQNQQTEEITPNTQTSSNTRDYSST